MLLCLGLRCWMITKAMFLSGGMWAKKASRASSPPADAPMATMGNPSDVSGMAAAFFLDFVFVTGFFFSVAATFFLRAIVIPPDLIADCGLRSLFLRCAYGRLGFFKYSG